MLHTALASYGNSHVMGGLLADVSHTPLLTLKASIVIPTLICLQTAQRILLTEGPGFELVICGIGGLPYWAID